MRIGFIQMLLALAAAVAIGGTALAAATAMSPGAADRGATTPAAATPSLVPILEAPIYRSTGGPYIGEQAALDLAARVARGPSAQQSVRMMTYREVVAFTGSQTLTVDLDREVYFVVTAGTFVGRHGFPTCASYMTVIDATEGITLSVICGDGTWPSRLPAGF